MISHVSLKTMWMSLLPLNSEDRSKSKEARIATPEKELQELRRGKEMLENPWSHYKESELFKTWKRGAKSNGSTYNQMWTAEERHTKGISCEAEEKYAVVEDSAAAESRNPRYVSCFDPKFSTFNRPGTCRAGEGEGPCVGGCWLYALTTDGFTQKLGFSPLSLWSPLTQSGKITNETISKVDRTWNNGQIESFYCLPSCSSKVWCIYGEVQIVIIQTPFVASFLKINTANYVLGTFILF